MSKFGTVFIEWQTQGVLWAIENKPTAVEFMMTCPLDPRPMEEIRPGVKVSQVDLVRMLAEASPKTLLVVRAYPDDYGCEDFQDRMLKWTEPFRKVSNRVVAHSANEPVPGTVDAAKRLNEYELGFIERMHSEGLIPMCFCLPESHLGGPTLGDHGAVSNWGALPLWQYMTQAVRRLAEVGGFLGFNEYDWPSWNSSRDQGYPWRLGHWALNLEFIGKWLKPHEIPKVGIGEGVLDGKIYTSRLPDGHRLRGAPWGYRRMPKPSDNLPEPFKALLVGKSLQAYLGDLVAIEEDSYRDPRVAFFLAFAWAPGHHDWDSYDVSTMADLLSQRLRDSPPEYWTPKEEQPMSDTVRAIDVSEYGGPVKESQFKAAYDAGIRLVVVQAWGGGPIPGGKNAYCEQQLAGARKAGLMTATYIWLLPDNTTRTEFLIQAAREAAGAEYQHTRFVVMDVEDGQRRLLHPTDPKARLADAISHVTDKPVVIYTSKEMWKWVMSNATGFERYPLWDARYDKVADLDTNWVPYGGWTQRAMKQHQGTTVSPGNISVCLSTGHLGRLGLLAPEPLEVEVLRQRVRELEALVVTRDEEIRRKTNVMTTARNTLDHELKPTT